MKSFPGLLAQPPLQSGLPSYCNNDVVFAVNVLGSEFDSGGGSEGGGPGVSISEITGQQSASSSGGSAAAAPEKSDLPEKSSAAQQPHQQPEPASDSGSTGSSGGQLLSLEPPLASSDYSFSLDDQENLGDLFELF